MLEFCLDAVAKGSEYFVWTMKNELDLTSQLNKETISNLESNNKELKTEINNTWDNFEEKMRSMETERAHLEARETTLKDQLKNAQEDTRRAEEDWKERLQTLKTESQRNVDEYKLKAATAEDQAKDMQRQVLQSESEFDKEKALLVQKIEHLESSLEAARKRETEQNDEIKSQKRELMNSIKDCSSKFESQIKELKDQVDQANEQLMEKDLSLTEALQKYEFEKKQWTDLEAKLRSDFTSADRERDELARRNDSMKLELEELGTQKTQELEEQNDELRLQIDELKSSLMNKEHSLESVKSQFEKKQAIIDQRNDFLQMQLNESNNQRDEDKKTYQQMIKALESKEKEHDSAKTEADKRIGEIQQTHKAELRELQKEFDAVRQRLTDDLESTRAKNNEMETGLKVKVAEQEKELKQLHKALQEAEDAKDRFAEENKLLDS